jgi:peptidoglycan-associated lipoprotein
MLIGLVFLDIKIHPLLKSVNAWQWLQREECKMFLRVKKVLAGIALVGLSVVGCTNDEKAPESLPESSKVSEPAAPPAVDQAQSFKAEAVYFAFDDYTLTNEARTALNSFGDHLKAHTAAQVQVEGHCDERGSVEYNLALGEKRAQSVKAYLASLGVDAARVQTISFGEEKPASEGHDESAWSRNRRAEFVLSTK